MPDGIVGKHWARLKTEPRTPEEIRRASKAVCWLADNDEDAKFLLEALGLAPGRKVE